MREKDTHKEAATPQPETQPQVTPAVTFTQPPQTPQKTAGSSLFVGPRRPALHKKLHLKTPASPPTPATVAATTKAEVANQENEGGPPVKEADGSAA